MDYRNERDALRGRVENLEQELAGAREAQGSDAERARRIAELEREMAEGQALLARMSHELDALRGPAVKAAPLAPPARKPSAPGRLSARALVLVVSSVAAVLLAVVELISAGPARHTDPAPPRATTAAPPAPAALPPPAPAAVPPPVATTSAPAPVERETTARWTARVKRASGRPLAAGSPCTVEAALQSEGASIRVRRLTVGCGKAQLYDSDVALEGISMSSSAATEEAGPAEGTVVYALGYEDKGTRTGPRGEVSIDTSAGAGAVWSDTAPAFRVELTLPYETDAMHSAPLLDATGHALRRGATVAGTDGPAPLVKGARCNLRVTPHPKGSNCIAHLACGRLIAYGQGKMGFSACTLGAGGEVLHFSDTEPTPEGGDPEARRGHRGRDDEARGRGRRRALRGALRARPREALSTPRPAPATAPRRAPSATSPCPRSRRRRRRARPGRRTRRPGARPDPSRSSAPTAPSTRRPARC